ncbi:MAG TPA: DUF5916 domain-containing protein [Vicinamibacterales bacterium]|nr:DUF5916 domain-containing protein [Vicinamibacterales bacterium]
MRWVRWVRWVQGFAALLVASSGTAFAQGPAVKAARVLKPPTIDGRLDDPSWANAARITDFVQRRPLDGAPATERTEVLIAYDSDRLYFGIYAHYSDASIVRANRVDRDQIWNDDRVSVIFDPFRDQQRGYRFAMNAYGVQGDALVASGGAGAAAAASASGPGDLSWNVLFASAGVLTSDGWTAEFAIPFKSLRYPARGTGEAHRWGLQIERDIEGKDENVVWAPLSRDVMSELGQMGTLDGMTNLSTSRNLEILPTVTAIQVGRLNAAGGFETDTVKEAGGNLKYGVTSNLTFDFTYNPDFSQIESDRQQIEINQRFPVLYPELRPFFLEGQEIFRIAGPITFIHTRTIVDPRYGAKLSGKVGKTTLGLLVANDEAPGRLDNRQDPAFGRTAQFVVGRARYDLYRESTASVIFTNREFMNQHSRAIGGDGDFAIGRTHRFFARVIATDHRDAAGVLRKGYFYDFNLRKAGRNVSYSLISNAISPDLRTDVGFVRRTDQRQSLGNISYRWWPEHWLVSWAPRLNHMRNYQFDGTLQEETSGLTGSFTFARNITAEAGVTREMERYRGVDFWKTRHSAAISMATSRRLTLTASMNGGDQIRFVADPFLGSTNAWDIAIALRPVSRFQSDFSVAASRFRDPRAGRQEFDVKIPRSLSTYQFTERLLVRNITEHNTLDKTVGENLLLTYRVNAGTVFYLGFDTRYRHTDQINPNVFPTDAYMRTNRAIFTKLQYLFRYQS